MATGLPLRMAQVPRTCQICDKDTKLKWKCLNCQFILCNSCGQRHSGDKSSVNHNVVNLRDIDEHSYLGDVKCWFHVKNKPKAEMYCLDCFQTICDNCLKRAHRKHDVRKLDEAYSMFTGNLNLNHKKIKTDMQYCEKEKNKLEKIILSHCKSFEEEKRKIITYDMHLKERITQRTEQLLEELDEHFRKSKAKITASSTVIENRLSILSEKVSLIEEHERTCKSDFDTVKKVAKDVQTFADEAESSFPIAPVNIMAKKFVLNETDKDSSVINPVFGLLVNVDIFGSASITCENIDSYCTDLPSIKSMTVDEKNNLWIASSNDSNLLRQVDFQKKTILQEFKDMNITDIAVSKRCSLLFIKDEDPTIKELDPKTNRIKDFHTCYSAGMQIHVPSALHVCKNSNVLVSTVEKGGDLYKVEKLSQIQVVVLSEFGKVLRMHKFYPEGRFLCMRPVKLTSNDYNEISYLGKLSPQAGALVIIDSKGKTKGILERKDNWEFNPVDIVTSNSGNIIASESHGALYIFSYEGVIIKKLTTEHTGIEYPMSLGIDKKGQLLVSFKTIFQT
ncbi:uncharacterized protein LOC134684346 [Mytilus trossulus]|uniref:uncharacterized protein LOC134684346 n=1 Tax=Mytilus trossulus TaxID=6551 RepID=UPI00300506D2